MAPERDTLAKLSAALDAAVLLLRAAIRRRAASGDNLDIKSPSGLTTPLSLEQGGTGGRTHDEARTAPGLVPGDPGFSALALQLYDTLASSVPVWLGGGPIPVARGQYYRQGSGGPLLKAE
ncbi:MULTISPECIES: hypothetical protein [Methylobacterium]|uniref:Uncharacterized protein n=2 Tax=Methylobacterium TaxID=407 RepID=A0A0C6FN37_9HYPH|nr:hypothetical protein [Methylobacterium aquaticum]BAQ46659.1 hypothetical protein Maq22A_c17760 [Methylobacterium aquaticum]